MESLGDADELGEDEQTPALLRPVASPEALAIASLALGVCSFFAGATFQYIFFVISHTVQSQRAQYLVFTAPMAALSALAVAFGLTAVRRERGDRWLAGIGGGGVILGGVGLLAMVVGLVLALSLDDPTVPNF